MLTATENVVPLGALRLGELSGQLVESEAAMQTSPVRSPLTGEIVRGTPLNTPSATNMATKKWRATLNGAFNYASPVRDKYLALVPRTSRKYVTALQSSVETGQLRADRSFWGD